jgi:hypothetical protein
MTYNRPPTHQHLLEEAIESFLRQDYPNKELLLLNDCEGQVLLFDHPRVRIFNIPNRYPTLGDKRRALAELATGDFIAPWDDDDISLPWRLSLSVERIGDAGYYNPQRYWYSEPDGLHHDHGVGNSHISSLYSRAAFKASGGYPSLTLGEDQVMHQNLMTKLPRRDLRVRELGTADLPIEEWFYIYRWGVSPVHLSGVADEGFYEEVGKATVQKGRYALQPHWVRDYVAETRAAIEHTRAQATPGESLSR